MLFSRTIYNEYTDIIKGSDKEGKREKEGDNYFSFYREGGRERLRKGGRKEGIEG